MATNPTATPRRGRPRRGETRIKMADANGGTVSVTFEEPEATGRTKRPWHELYPDARNYVDAVLKAFMDNFGNEQGTKGDDGKVIPFSRKVSGLNIPLERDSEHPNNRAVRLLNDRCDALKLKCHAAIRGGNVYLVLAPRKITKRTRKPKTETANA